MKFQSLLWTMILALSIGYAQETVRDEFGTVSYANNDGSVNWSGDWDEINDNDNASNGEIRITGNRLRFRAIDSDRIIRSADLSTATTATLTFSWETSSLEGSERLVIQASSDGTSFTTIGTFDGTNTGSFNDDITSYISATTTIRFRKNGADWNQGNDQAFVDDVQIAYTVGDQAPTLTATGNQTFCPSNTNSIPVAQTISITDPDDTTMNEVSVQISGGYVEGQDFLALTGTHPNITTAFTASEGKLLLTGPATLAEFETAVLAVVYSASMGIPSGVKQFAISVGDAQFFPGTGHFYEFVPIDGIRWDDARDAAAARTYFGLEGYLATLSTSDEEAVFAGSQITGNGWIGATDTGAEGVWTWVTGPETGTVFWNGDENGTVVPGEFEFWNNNEPNDYPNDSIDGEENYAHITAPGIGIEHSWNDLPIVGGGGAYSSRGYIVEYGGMPGDPVLDISDVTTINVGCTIITNRNITYRVNK